MRVSAKMRRGLLLLLACFAVLLTGSRSWADTSKLPQYDLNLTLDTAKHKADIRLLVTWTNAHARPTKELVFNFYPHYRIPKGDLLHLAKTLELLRLNPSDGIDLHGRHGTLDRVSHVATNGKTLPLSTPLSFRFANDNPTAIIVDLPVEVGPGESVTVDVEATIRLPNKQGRWGHWQGVSFLTNALPVVAYYNDVGWHAVPFVPWHQPWWNEAGHFKANIRLPAEQKLACSAPVQSEIRLANNWKQITTEPFIGRDFAILASADYVEHTLAVPLPNGQEVKLKCLAFPKHEFYAKEILRIASEAIPVYAKWFGAVPNAQITYAESFFGWNGNECAGLVMIDERVFGMPHLATGYVEYLVSHETCHQWWYNLIGTNGYGETFMDEGAATYFTHRLLDRKHGKNNAMLKWPSGAGWMPNIHRENYRNSSLYGAIRRNEMPAAAGDLPGFNHLVGLFSGAYDRGSRIFGMIEERLGEDAFLDFTKGLVQKYSWKVFQAANLKAELEAYTGQKWDEFFDRWVYGKGITDWQVESVKLESPQQPKAFSRSPAIDTRQRVSVIVRQTADYNEPTTLGFRMPGDKEYSIRVPVVHQGQTRKLDEHETVIETLRDGSIRIDLTLPAKPEQISIDPDRVLLDKNPANNVWKPEPRFSVVPLYTTLNENDLTTDYDRWNFGVGPWIGGALYPDPWYTRSTMLGARAGVYRTQIYSGGLYAAYRSDVRDVVIGADGLWDHWPLPKTQLGFSVEQRVAGPFSGNSGRDTATRAGLFSRYVFQYGSSFYLPPLHYAEVFSTYQDNFLPFARERATGAVRPDWTYLSGLHYRLNLYTPYWDPECGVWVDATYGSGVAQLEQKAGLHQLRGELAAVKKLPWNLGPLTGTRVAGRFVVQGAFPQRGEFFALGGGTLFRGYDLGQRQGSALWVANAELRLPLARDVEWDVLDHTAGTRNLWLTLFYDVGDVYTNGRSVGGISHALGAGIRMDTALFSFIERVTLRFDVAKTIDDNTPFQFWFGVQHPF